jgi:VanZ family protein
MALIFAVSHLPNHKIPQQIERLPDKLLHLAEYVPLGFLWARVVGGPAWRRLLFGWLAASLFGLTDEIHQAFVPGRQEDLLDWSADSTGAFLGALFCVASQRRKKNQKNDARPKVHGGG